MWHTAETYKDQEPAASTDFDLYQAQEGGFRKLDARPNVCSRQAGYRQARAADRFAVVSVRRWVGNHSIRAECQPNNLANYEAALQNRSRQGLSPIVSIQLHDSLERSTCTA